jgi:hypothetical protein
MKTKKTLFVILSVVILLSMSVSFATAQGPLPDDPQDDDVIVSNVESSLMNDNFPVQGRLTNAAGNPVPDGQYDFVVKIYDVATLGTALCTNTLNNQSVTNGLFNLSVDACTAADITGDALYLGIAVQGDPEMTPRQQLYPVPYAIVADRLEPGSVIQGANSYLFVPGTGIVKDKGSDSTRWDMSNATALIYRGTTAGAKYVYLPITIPAVLYGQAVRVTNVRVYYNCETANNFITSTYMVKMTDADTALALLNDSTDLNATTASYHDFATLSTDDANLLSSTQGFLAIRFYITFANDTEFVRITGVRLTLDHTP